MSLCLRPVVETWGEGLTYSTRWIDMDDLIAALVQYAGEDTGEGKESVLDLEPLVHETSTYGDMRTVYISDGERFLNALTLSQVVEQDRTVTLQAAVPWNDTNATLYGQAVAGAAGTLAMNNLNLRLRKVRRQSRHQNLAVDFFDGAPRSAESLLRPRYE